MTNKETIYRQDVLDLAKKGILVSNGNYESVCKAINEIPAVNPQPCEDAISRQAVLDIVDSYSESRSNVEDVTQDMISDILALPPVTPKPKTGHWIRQDNTKKPLYGWYFCSECNSVIGDKPKFCSNCGAKMVEPQERSDKE